MKFTRVIQQTINAVQYDGTNMKEVYDFICSYRGNANGVLFEDLNKRPSHIPLDVDSQTLYTSKFGAWKEKYKDAIEKYKQARRYSDAEESDFFTKEALDERNYIDTLTGDWRKNEEYHFHLSTGDGYCRLIGICKGDWFVFSSNMDHIEHMSEGRFFSCIEDGGYSKVD